jgi:16S rRNA (guanine(966)-N(2))-methyltransferase RsmD
LSAFEICLTGEGDGILRIISGTRRGQKLFEFDGMDIRPTTDRVRESLFNLIQNFVPEAKVLDLFGGSGALSLEALSRGASEAAVCDIDKRSLELIKKNTAALRFEDRLMVIRQSAEQYLKSTKEKFDIIFLDPPYNKGYIKPIITAIVSGDILSGGGIIVLESDGTDEHGDFDGLDTIKQRKYGRTYITVYQRGDKG